MRFETTPFGRCGALKIRGTLVPSSTRCTTHTASFFSSKGRMHNEESRSAHNLCVCPRCCARRVANHGCSISHPCIITIGLVCECGHRVYAMHNEAHGMLRLLAYQSYDCIILMFERY